MEIFSQRAGPELDQRNQFIESLNGKLRAKFLNQHWLMSLDEP